MSNPTRFAVASILALSFLCSLTLAQDSVGIGVTNSTKNPVQIAILHWHDANLTTTFPVGSIPLGMAFDGVNLWVVNFGDNNVAKVQPSTGKVLGISPVGSGPNAAALIRAGLSVALPIFSQGWAIWTNRVQRLLSWALPCIPGERSASQPAGTEFARR